MSHKEVGLKIEHFYRDEDLEFRISSRMEMLSILQGIADEGARVALFYGRGQDFILTTLLGVNEHGMWLDVGPLPLDNKQILLSGKITFVSVHQHVKIQFVAQHIENDLFENSKAFYLELPEYLLRIQRREFFRTHIPSTAVASCIIPVQPENPDAPVIMRTVPIDDISGGGIALICEEDEDTLLPNKIFPGCRILLPHVGSLKGTIAVRYNIDLSEPHNVPHKRVGCSFDQRDNQMDILLQQHITRLQSEGMGMQCQAALEKLVEYLRLCAAYREIRAMPAIPE